MCGIVGYVGNRSSAEVLLGGLRRLEYRGYDSAGVAILEAHGSLVTQKRAGKLSVLDDELAASPLPEGHTGIAHTRWATHGPPTDNNAHPHLGDANKLALIHNGIIENFAELKKELEEAGETFASDTDSEVAALMLGRSYQELGDLTEAMRQVVSRLEGAFTLLAVHQDAPGVVVGARRNSPLVVGLGEGENFLGSDVAAFVAYTHKALAVGQDQIVTLTADTVTVTTFAGDPVEATPFDVDWDASAADKGGWSSFMAKEIAEEPEAVANTIRGRLSPEGLVTIPELDTW
jgi:glutamine---fructose-6-phosphate transaminase (isomerizing)